jgi:hypothetical protein
MMESLERPSGGDRWRLVWGLLLIFLGVVALIWTFVDIRAFTWVALLACAGLVAFVIYLTDRASWGLLIPTYVLWAIAGLIALAEFRLIADAFKWAYGLTAAALPFVVVFLRDRKQWWALIPAYTMLAIAVMIPLIEYNIMQDAFIATYVLTAIAVPFLAIFVRDRKQWWALIPAYIMLVIGAMVPLIEGSVLTDSFIATYILTVIALPFVLVFVLDTERWWALIPAYVLMAIGVMIWLIDIRILRGVGIAAYIAFAGALPFFAAFVRNPREQWPLIPALIGAVIGAAFVMVGTFTQYVLPAVLIVMGGGLLILQFTRREPGSADEAGDVTTPKPSV